MNRILILAFAFFLCQNCSEDKNGAEFQSKWSESKSDRTWAGGEYWLNPLQAWRQKDGQLRCETSGGDRNAVLLTRSINNLPASFQTSVTIQPIENKPLSATLYKGLSPIGWAGFQIGLKGQFDDYRDDAIKGRGLSVGLTDDGAVFIGDLEHSSLFNGPMDQPLNLSLFVDPSVDGELYNVKLICSNLTNTESAVATYPIHKSWLPGLIALTCSQSLPDSINRKMERPHYNDIQDLHKSAGGNTNYAFSDWHLSGEKLDQHDERSYGPILWAQHTLSDSTMKMSVQLTPDGRGQRICILLIDDEDEVSANVDKLGNNALFRVENWVDSIDHNYVVTYKDTDGLKHSFAGTIAKQPNGIKLKVASLSCVDDRGFPHQDLVDNVASHQPDLLSFHGDQLYERVAGYGVEHNSILDYQRKWYIFGWSFRDLLRDIPAVIIPDDHDVFHGNLWGEGGKAASTAKGFGNDSQDSGGYKENPEFVNMVHRTQTGHLPDPIDPKPVQQDISVYYTNMNYGGVSFAILGDRQWKSAPRDLFPDAEIENGWPQNKSWNAKTSAYHPKAHLLGDRQEAFLADWVVDWNDGIKFKAVISQSPFCNVATLPAHIYHDKFVPGLPRYKKGEYPTDDRPVADFDSNGWPQKKRNKAINTIRKAFAIHLTGDQHLGSTGQYGIDEYGDGGYWVSSPAVANLWPRRWFPAEEATSGKPNDDKRRYTGDYEDGFGNKITVKGIANPYDIDREPSMVFDKAPGYSIITFDKESRQIEIAVWPRWAGENDSEVDNKPYEDWPIRIDQTDNYGREVTGYLKKIEVNGSTVISVINESTNEVEYSFPPTKGTFAPFVFDNNSTYRIEKKMPYGITKIKKMSPRPK